MNMLYQINYMIYMVAVIAVILLFFAVNAGFRPKTRRMLHMMLLIISAATVVISAGMAFDSEYWEGIWRVYFASALISSAVYGAVEWLKG